MTPISVDNLNQWKQWIVHAKNGITNKSEIVMKNRRCNIPQSASQQVLRRVFHFSLVLKDHSTDHLQVLPPPGVFDEVSTYLFCILLHPDEGAKLQPLCQVPDGRAWPAVGRPRVQPRFKGHRCWEQWSPELGGVWVPGLSSMQRMSSLSRPAG